MQLSSNPGILVGNAPYELVSVAALQVGLGMMADSVQTRCAAKVEGLRRVFFNGDLLGGLIFSGPPIWGRQKGASPCEVGVLLTLQKHRKH